LVFIGFVITTLCIQIFMLQPTLLQTSVTLRPLVLTDFEDLFRIASDELLWEQHPAKERSQHSGFEVFFDKALQSAGALSIIDNQHQQIIGTSRYYEWKENESVAIGYTFIARQYWGTPYNRIVKNLMIQHAFTFVPNIFFYVDSENFRSQKAVEKLGAVLLGYQDTVYSNLPTRKSCIYQLTPTNWQV
jgi:RimJ/RimL family protein N-acetyltransferase